MATHTTEPTLTKQQLETVVRTGQGLRGVGTMRALAMLRERPRIQAGELLMEVATGRDQQPRFRHMAAMGLYEMGGRKAEEALTKAAQHADPAVAGTLALGLGRVGSADRMPIVEELAAAAAPHVKERAEFGATLLSYRHRMDGHDVRFPTSRQLQDLGRHKFNPIEVSGAPAGETELAAAALRLQPLHIPLSHEHALIVQCEPNTFAWLWTSPLVRGGFSAVAQRKGVAAVMFRKSRFERKYALSALALATPSTSGVRLTVHRADSGKVMYAGTLDEDGTLELKSRIHPGLAAIEFKAKFDGVKPEILQAKSAAVALEARAPKAG